ncbi:MAG: hypothetical protein QXO15_11720 [Nitrososphaerota archaeon]
MLSDRQILIEAEGALNEFYCSVSPVWRLRTCNIYLPRIERIVKNLEEKPDLIIYAGDDVNEIEERGRRNLEREISLLKKHFQIMDPAEEIPILSEELREATERVKSKNIMLFNSKLLTMI